MRSLTTLNLFTMTKAFLCETMRPKFANCQLPNYILIFNRSTKLHDDDDVDSSDVKPVSHDETGAVTMTKYLVIPLRTSVVWKH